MTKLKRPERYVQFESIKPELKEITEFYTRKTADYQYKIKQLNEYADALENEISVLKETPKVEVLLDDMAKPPVTVPQLVARYIETEKDNDYNRVGTLVYGHYEAIDGYEEYSELHKWIADNFDTFLEAIVNGYTVEKEKKYYLCEKNTGYYLNKKGDGLKLVVNPYFDDNNKFTQSEIDKLNIGSYEQIEVDK